MNIVKRELWLHRLFKLTILIKGIDGLLEILSAFILIFSSAQKIIPFLVGPEILEDPQDKIANYLLHLSHSIVSNTETFLIAYLMVHGLIKVAMALALQGKNLHAYKMAGYVLTLFVTYQFYRFTHTHSTLLLVFSLLDVLTLFLVYHEYQRLKVHA